MFISSNRFMGGEADTMKSGKRNRVFSKTLLLTVLACSALALTACGKKGGADGESGDGSGTSTEPIVALPEGLTPSSNQEIVNLINTYYNALQNGDSATVAAVKKDVTEEEKIRLEIKAADIESYDNVTVCDQPGMNPGEYIILVYSETKVVGIDTRAPGVVASYIKTDDSGSLCINSMVDEPTMNYVQTYVSSEPVQNYYNLVSAAYADAIANDPALNTYMQSIDAKLDAAVAQRQADAAAAEAEAGAEGAGAAPVNETVTTTDKVNVRVSDSENADKLGQVEAGTSLTRYEVRENGWSKIDYNGTEGFIKSEFLKSNTASDAGTGDAAQTETATTEAPAASTGKTVEAKETVKVRASASTEAEILGLIGPDMKFSLIEEQSDGWSKIDYNGKTGYVKTEFVTIK